MFSIKTYTDRRNRLCQSLKQGLVIIQGNDDSPMNYTDNPYPFRQDSTFLYYFGIDFQGLTGIIDIDENKEIIFGNDYTIDEIVWMGPQPTIAERAAQTGISCVEPVHGIAAYIDKALQKHQPIHFISPYRHDNKIKLAAWLHLPIETLDEKASLPLIKSIVSQREIKSAEELAEIEKGVDISVDMHVAAMKSARPGMTEAQVAAKVEEVALAANGYVSFLTIATKNGQTLHNHYHGNILQEGDLFLLDAGAETPVRYCGDLSSTFPVSKTFSDRQKMIYEISLQAHQAAIDTLALGVPFRQVHLAACRCIAENMKALGMLKGHMDDIIEQGVHALFIQCGTGHQMGLDVHDMENLGEVWVGYDGEPKSTQFGLKSLRFAKPLRPGHVFTIEPGIYFIPELMDLWKSQKKFSDFIVWNEVEKWRDFGGIRNEENYTMTATGPKRLGNKVKPKTIAEVEALRV